MELYLSRFDQTENGTTGMMYIDGKFVGFTVERPWKENQKTISCIPEGRYSVGFRNDPTPLTITYRNKYDFFNFHLEVQGVKDRTGIYIHVANFVNDVEGCIGIASGCGEPHEHKIYGSKKLYRQFYIKLKGSLDKGEPVMITIDKRKV